MYNQSDEQIKSILDVWKIIEVLTPNKNENLNRYFEIIRSNTDKKGSFSYNLDKNKKETLFFLKDAPFEKLDKKELGKELEINLNEYEVVVHWHVYLGYLKWSAAEIDLLKKIQNINELDQEFLNDYNNKNYQEQPTITPIAGLTIDENGKYVEHSMIISTAAYALGKIMKEDFQGKELKDLADFVDNNNILIDEVFAESEKIYFMDKPQDSALGRILDLEMINIMIALLVQKLEIDRKYLFSRSEICVRRVTSQKKKKDKSVIFTPPSLEMFNSFFLIPLDLVRHNIEKFESESAIAKYLGKEDKPDSIDVLKQQDALQNLLSPFIMQSARWCSSPKNSLAALQAAAVNEVLSPTSEKLFAVNGPPGTGKTTILFDIIANIYVGRALNLISLEEPKNGFQKGKISHSTPDFDYHISSLKPELQNYGMVVASSNNNAVENISNEISLYSKIDELYHEDLSYFKQLVYVEDKEKNWGMFATPLGNLKNKKKFINSFWKFKDDEKGNDEDYTMLQYLNLLIGNKCKDRAPGHYKPKYCNSSEELNKAWSEACTNFKKIHSKINKIYNNISSVIELNKERRNILEKNNIVNKHNIKDYEEEKAHLESILIHARNEIMINTTKINDYNLNYFKVFYKLFKTEKYLAYSNLLQQQEEKVNYEKVIITKINNFKRLIDISKLLSEPYKFLEDENFNIKDFEENLFWKNWQENSEDLNKITPYFNPKFEIFRSALFVSAVKLHEIFINANADSFWHSLKYFFDITINSLGKPEMNKIAWQNFFMIIPVVSTTFHSFDRMFATAKHNEVPWLFIDEAGQIPPQFAASAIYKSKKVVVVGDPLQTEPISILKQDLIKKLCENFKVSYRDWSPLEVSLQNLADRTSLYQTKIDDVTVGFPLLVHRRCQNPMFKICNKIAYGNKMIFATSKCKSSIRAILGASKWIDVEENNVQRYKYESETEFQKLLELLKQVLKEKNGDDSLKQIYIITMYKGYSEFIRKN